MNKNEFALTPPMGWNSFDYYDANVREEEIRANAAYQAEHLKQYGWEYVVVDIQWYAYDTGTQREQFEYIPFSRMEMDEYGRLQPCPDRFPSSKGGKGFAPLAEYVHSLGLKFGIHIMRGIPRAAAELHLPVKGSRLRAHQIADPSSVCLWNPDMYGLRNLPESQCYYDSLMELYASWGVDFVKCDDICNARSVNGSDDAQENEIRMLHAAIQKCGRPIVLSLSPGPALLDRGSLYAKYANMWRVTGDFWDNWEQLKDMFDRCEKWASFVKKGCYPDCDMLPLGWIGKEFLQERRTRFTMAEQETMMTLWCICHSPLFLGAELTRLESDTLALITNKEVLHLDQAMDNTVLQLYKDEKKVIWISEEKDDETFYAALFNLEDVAAKLELPKELLAENYILTDDEANVIDVWSKKAAEEKDGYETAPHGVRLLRCKKR